MSRESSLATAPCQRHGAGGRRVLHVLHGNHSMAGAGLCRSDWALAARAVAGGPRVTTVTDSDNFKIVLFLQVKSQGL